MAETLDPRALCTPADVKGLLPGADADDASIDDDLIRIINSESRQIWRESGGREFVGPVLEEDDDPIVRSFPITRDVVEERILAIGDIATDEDLGVELRLVDGTAVETVAAGAIVTLPRNRFDAWETIEELEFPLGLSTSAQLRAGQVAFVTATWGFSAIPSDIREACAYRVISKGLVDLVRVSSAFEEAAAQGFDVSKGLAAGFKAIRGYRTPVIA